LKGFLAIVDGSIRSILGCRECFEGEPGGLEEFGYTLSMVSLNQAACIIGRTLSISLSCWIRSAFVKGSKVEGSASASDGVDIVWNY
jgi:hypothetical protein